MSIKSLQVFSARIGHPDPDAFDITRKGADAARGARQDAPGEPFAPSWKVLRPALDARSQHEELMRRAANAVRFDLIHPEREDGWALALAAEELAECAWNAYLLAYLAEMRASYRAHSASWKALLACSRVVLTCYCHDAEHCHRGILRAKILPALGAVDCGELPPVPRASARQTALPGFGGPARGL